MTLPNNPKAEDILAFVLAQVAQEREECAKVVEGYRYSFVNCTGEISVIIPLYKDEIAAAIRNRGSK